MNVLRVLGRKEGCIKIYGLVEEEDRRIRTNKEIGHIDRER
jgi:hypothetical protein